MAAAEVASCWSGGTGRRTGLKIPRSSLSMWVRPPPPALLYFRRLAIILDFRRALSDNTPHLLNGLFYEFAVVDSESWRANQRDELESADHRQPCGEPCEPLCEPSPIAR
jgi:hypothetical protein